MKVLPVPTTLTNTSSTSSFVTLDSTASTTNLSVPAVPTIVSTSSLQSDISSHQNTSGSDIIPKPVSLYRGDPPEPAPPITMMNSSTPRPAASILGSSSTKRLLSHVRTEHLVAGVTGGVVSTLVLHPLDLVKIRFAVSDGLTSRPQYNGLYDAFKCIWKTEGIKGLYRGVTPNVWGAGSAWGLYFFFYTTMKDWWQGGDTRKDLGASRHMVIASEAGLVTLLFTNPLWVVKTRLCLQYGLVGDLHAASVGPGGTVAATTYSGMTDALRKIWKLEGMRGLYKGFVPGIFGVSHGAIQFMTYEEMKTVYNQYRLLPIDTKLGTVEYLTFAAISKLIAAATTYPYQVVRARLQDQHRSYTGVMDVIRQTWSAEGVRAFYKGLYPNLLRVVPATALTFVIYEKTATYLAKLKKDKQNESEKGS